MKTSLRHIFLAIGLASLPLSYILIAHDFSVFLFGFSYLTILAAIVSVLKKDKIKTALTCLFVSVVMFMATMFFKDTLKAYSYRNLILANENLLAKANQILVKKTVDVTYSSTFLNAKDDFSNEELSVLRAVTKNLNARFIRKDSRTIYYCTDGVMDSDYGIWYFYNDYTPKNFLHIKDRWYYD